jgi:hypothetical protein
MSDGPMGGDSLITEYRHYLHASMHTPQGMMVARCSYLSHVAPDSCSTAS